MKELADKIRAIGERARYSSEPGRVLEELANAIADSMDPPADAETADPQPSA